MATSVATAALIAAKADVGLAAFALAGAEGAALATRLIAAFTAKAIASA